METVLMVVTLVSLVLAVGMSVLAWRLLRDDRHRSGARSEALRELAASPEIDDEPALEIRRPVPAPAPAPRPPAVTRQPNRAGPAFDQMRFRSVEDDAQAVLGWDTALTPAWRGAAPREPSPARADAGEVRGAEVAFGATAERGVPGRRWAVLAVVAVIMAGAAGAVYGLYRPQIIEAIPSARELASAPASGALPIELLSLRHEIDRDGGFTVTGLVQNPAGGRAAHHVIAVIYLFDRNGNYFATGRAPLDFIALQPGEESPFVVHVPSVSGVSRYRVGFRAEDGGVVSHVDRRGQLPGGTTGDSIGARPAVGPVTASRGSEGL